MCSIVDPSILARADFRLIKECFKGAIQKNPTYIFDFFFFFFWKFQFIRNDIKLKESKFQGDIHNECTTDKLDRICKGCDNSMLKNRMLMQAQLNQIELCPKWSKRQATGSISLFQS